MSFVISEYIFECQSCTQFLDIALAGTLERGVRKPRGSIIALAHRLNCHTSFISQVLKEQAQFSIDQAILTADHFSLTGSSRDQWIDLVLRQRAGCKEGQDYFTARIQDRVKARKNLSQRWEAKLGLSEHESFLFFSNWISQIIYSVLHLPEQNTKGALEHSLQLSSNEVSNTLDLLERLKLVTKNKDQYLPQKNLLHLPKNSPVIRLHHQTWRNRSIEEFTRASELKGFHYSGAVTLSKFDAEQINNELLELLDRVRGKIQSTVSEESYALIIDFFKTTKM
jgi:hypothetical protein